MGLFIRVWVYVALVDRQTDRCLCHDTDSSPRRQAWGGRRCRGKREEWKVCGTDECQLPRQDFRGQQCHLLPRIVKLDRRRAALSWLPYEPKSSELRASVFVCV